MSIPNLLKGRLSIPVIAAPMFIISNPKLVIAQCKAGVVGAFPTLNARALSQLEEWLALLNRELTDRDAPYAANLIVHKSNDRLMEDLDLCVKYRVPIVITSLGAREDVNEAIHSYGGFVFHDVIHNSFGRKAIERGADGLIPVTAGAGGHAGTLSPFALVQELRDWFDGPIALSGSIANGDAVLAAQAMGADLAYIGSAFIATDEAQADRRYKDMVVEATAKDIVYSSLFTGVHGNYLRPSIEAAGLDPDNLPDGDRTQSKFGSSDDAGIKAWKEIWGCGQGVGAVKGIVPAADLVARLTREYADARERIAALS